MKYSKSFIETHDLREFSRFSWRTDPVWPPTAGGADTPAPLRPPGLGRGRVPSLSAEQLPAQGQYQASKGPFSLFCSLGRKAGCGSVLAAPSPWRSRNAAPSGRYRRCPAPPIPLAPLRSSPPQRIFLVVLEFGSIATRKALPAFPDGFWLWQVEWGVEDLCIFLGVTSERQRPGTCSVKSKGGFVLLRDLRSTWC